MSQYYILLLVQGLRLHLLLFFSVSVCDGLRISTRRGIGCDTSENDSMGGRSVGNKRGWGCFNMFNGHEPPPQIPPTESDIHSEEGISKENVYDETARSREAAVRNNHRSWWWFGSEDHWFGFGGVCRDKCRCRQDGSIHNEPLVKLDGDDKDEFKEDALHNEDPANELTAQLRPGWTKQYSGKSATLDHTADIPQEPPEWERDDAPCGGYNRYGLPGFFGCQIGATKIVNMIPVAITKMFGFGKDPNLLPSRKKQKGGPDYDLGEME